MHKKHAHILLDTWRPIAALVGQTEIVARFRLGELVFWGEVTVLDFSVGVVREGVLTRPFVVSKVVVSDFVLLVVAAVLGVNVVLAVVVSLEVVGCSVVGADVVVRSVVVVGSGVVVGWTLPKENNYDKWQ